MNRDQKILVGALALALAAGSFTSAHGAQQGAAQAPAAPTAQSQPLSSGPAAATPDSSLLNMKAGEISGRQVYNSAGKELGKVDMIGRDRTTGNLSAIISVGGFLGFGGSKVAMPLEQLVLQDDKLIASTPMSKKELRQQSDSYQEKRYEAVAEDTTLNQVAAASAGATTGGVPPQFQSQTPAGEPPASASGSPAMGAASFQTLDSNSDGYLTSDEVSSNQAIVGRWRTLDKNNDGRLDQSEFSAFESEEPSTRPGGETMRERPAPTGAGDNATPTVPNSP